MRLKVSTTSSALSQPPLCSQHIQASSADAGHSRSLPHKHPAHAAMHVRQAPALPLEPRWHSSSEVGTMEAVGRSMWPIRCCTGKPSNSCCRGNAAGQLPSMHTRGSHMSVGGACLEPVAAREIAGHQWLSCNSEHDARLSAQQAATQRGKLPACGLYFLWALP